MAIKKKIVDLRDYVDTESDRYKDCKTNEDVRKLMDPTFAAMCTLSEILHKFEANIRKVLLEAEHMLYLRETNSLWKLKYREKSKNGN